MCNRTVSLVVIKISLCVEQCHSNATVQKCLRRVYVSGNGQRDFRILSLISFTFSTLSIQKDGLNRTGSNPVNTQNHYISSPLLKRVRLLWSTYISHAQRTASIQNPITSKHSDDQERTLYRKHRFHGSQSHGCHMWTISLNSKCSRI